MNENRAKRNKLLGERVIQGLQSRNMEGFTQRRRKKHWKLR